MCKESMNDQCSEGCEKVLLSGYVCGPVVFTEDSSS